VNGNRIQKHTKLLKIVLFYAHSLGVRLRRGKKGTINNGGTIKVRENEASENEAFYSPAVEGQSTPPKAGKPGEGEWTGFTRYQRE
jgi:hypothetical protein